MTFRLLAVASVITISMTLLTPLNAQTAPNAQAPRTVPRTKPPTQAAPPVRVAVVEQKCLRALNGACTNPTSGEAARLRAIIIPAVRVSYLGTPAGTIGGDYIPFERL